MSEFKDSSSTPQPIERSDKSAKSRAREKVIKIWEKVARRKNEQIAEVTYEEKMPEKAPTPKGRVSPEPQLVGIGREKNATEIRAEIEALRQNPNLSDPVLGLKGQLEKRKQMLSDLGVKDTGFPSEDELMTEYMRASIDLELGKGSSKEAVNQLKKRWNLVGNLGRKRVNILHNEFQNPDWKKINELSDERLARGLLIWKEALARNFYMSNSDDRRSAEHNLKKLEDAVNARGIVATDIVKVDDIKKIFQGPSNSSRRRRASGGPGITPDGGVSIGSGGIDLATGKPSI